MKILVLIALGALLTGCASPQPVALESPTQQPTQSQTEATPEATDSVASPETDMPAEEVEEQVDQEVRTETATTEAAPQETTSSAPRATASPTASATPTPTRTQAAAPTATPTPTPTATESRLSMANIAKNNSAASCWVAISGNAYDLTRWIAVHPGDAPAILGLCGTDATSRFQGQHGGQAQPLATLDSYLLGAVGS
jgi:cytochrome b involved in lipid metabolism